MLDLIFEAGKAIFEVGEDILTGIGEALGLISVEDVILIGGAIYVANLTVSSIQNELRNRRELKAKGATHVVIKEFIKENEENCTVISFAAMNAQNKQVGTFKMKGKSCSGLREGQTIAI